MAEKVHDFKSIGHQTLAGMAAQKLGSGNVVKALTSIETQAAENGHDAFVPVPVVEEKADGTKVIRGSAKPASSTQQKERGRIFVFVPTKERVTLLRYRVGQNYNGGWVHEVTTREGKKFLAAGKQLADLKG